MKYVAQVVFWNGRGNNSNVRACFRSRTLPSPDYQDSWFATYASDELIS